MPILFYGTHTVGEDDLFIHLAPLFLYILLLSPQIFRQLALLSIQLFVLFIDVFQFLFSCQVLSLEESQTVAHQLTHQIVILEAQSAEILC